LGTIYTHGNPDGVHQHSLAGVGAVWQTSQFRGNKNLMIGGWTAMTAGDLPSGKRSGWGGKIDYPNDLWDCSFPVNESPGGNFHSQILSYYPETAPVFGFIHQPLYSDFCLEHNYVESQLETRRRNSWQR
jgi:hypothetical protein